RQPRLRLMRSGLRPLVEGSGRGQGGRLSWAGGSKKGPGGTTGGTDAGATLDIRGGSRRGAERRRLEEPGAAARSAETGRSVGWGAGRGGWRRGGGGRGWKRC